MLVERFSSDVAAAEAAWAALRSLEEGLVLPRAEQAPWGTGEAGKAGSDHWQGDSRHYAMVRLPRPVLLAAADLLPHADELLAAAAADGVAAARL